MLARIVVASTLALSAGLAAAPTAQAVAGTPCTDALGPVLATSAAAPGFTVTLDSTSPGSHDREVGAFDRGHARGALDVDAHLEFTIQGHHLAVDARTSGVLTTSGSYESVHDQVDGAPRAADVATALGYLHRPTATHTYLARARSLDTVENLTGSPLALASIATPSLLQSTSTTNPDGTTTTTCSDPSTSLAITYTVSADGLLLSLDGTQSIGGTSTPALLRPMHRSLSALNAPLLASRHQIARALSGRPAGGAAATATLQIAYAYATPSIVVPTSTVAAGRLDLALEAATLRPTVLALARSAAGLATATNRLAPPKADRVAILRETVGFLVDLANIDRVIKIKTWKWHLGVLVSAFNPFTHERVTYLDFVTGSVAHVHRRR